MWSRLHLEQPLGDVITYTFKVKNTGDVTLTSVGLSDVLKDAKGGALSLTTPIAFGSASNGSSAGTLVPGETAPTPPRLK